MCRGHSKEEVKWVAGKEKKRKRKKELCAWKDENRGENEPIGKRKIDK